MRGAKKALNGLGTKKNSGTGREDPKIKFLISPIDFLVQQIFNLYFISDQF